MKSVRLWRYFERHKKVRGLMCASWMRIRRTWAAGPRVMIGGSILRCLKLVALVHC